jgi:RNA polymerase sigma factor (TIGR02999 family)
MKPARFPGYNVVMSDVTQILAAIKQGDQHAASQLLPLVYDELRKLAVARMAQESPRQTLQATALVHEAYLRLVGPGDAIKWDNRGHFFAAAAEAMRRILVENARRKNLPKHGGGRRRIDRGTTNPRKRSAPSARIKSTRLNRTNPRRRVRVFGIHCPAGCRLAGRALAYNGQSTVSSCLAIR